MGATLSPAQLQAYLQRIKFPASAVPPQPTLTTLQQLHTAHVKSIPFSNLHLTLSTASLPAAAAPVSNLQIDTLVGRLVEQNRGGYCFEQNTLFAAVLRTCGFRVQEAAARVIPDRVRPLYTPDRGLDPPLQPVLDHQVLFVEAGGSQWLADVGFGTKGPTSPLDMGRPMQDQPSGRVAFRLRPGNIAADSSGGPSNPPAPAAAAPPPAAASSSGGVGGGSSTSSSSINRDSGAAAGPLSQPSVVVRPAGWFLQWRGPHVREQDGGGVFHDLYYVSSQPCFAPGDFELLDHCIRTWPGTGFRDVHMACIHTDGGRATMLGSTIKVYEDGRDVVVVELGGAGEQELRRAVRQYFGIDLSG